MTLLAIQPMTHDVRSQMRQRYRAALAGYADNSWLATAESCKARQVREEIDRMQREAR